jgi:adenosylhomocysteinase
MARYAKKFGPEQLKEKGTIEIAEVSREMPVLQSLEKELIQQQSFRDITLAVNTHLETKAGYLVQILADSGARVLASSPTPRSVERHVEAVLKGHPNVELFVSADWTQAKCERHRVRLLKEQPQGILDDGCHLLKTAVAHRLRAGLSELKWCVEQTTRGVREARAIQESQGQLPCPLVAVGSSELKGDMDSQKGTGQSVIDKIQQLLNLLWGHEVKVVIVGFGPVGQGLAQVASRRGADVTITEINPVRAMKAITGVEAVAVKPLLETIRDARPARHVIVIGATGTRGAVKKDHFDAAPDGCVFANAASGNDEILVSDLEALSSRKEEKDLNITDYYVDGKRLRVLTGGWPVNLAVRGPGFNKGHPPDVIDVTFSLMLCSAMLLMKTARRMKKRVFYPSSELPEIDRFVASRYLELRGVKIERPYSRP